MGLRAPNAVPAEVAFAESLANGSAVSTVYTTTLTDFPGLILPQVVIGAAPVMLTASILLSCSQAAATAVAGIWEGATELQRAFATIDTAAKYAQLTLRKRLPPGDGITPRDFRVCFGLLAAGGTIVPALGQTANSTSATFSAETV